MEQNLVIKSVESNLTHPYPTLTHPYPSPSVITRPCESWGGMWTGSILAKICSVRRCIEFFEELLSTVKRRKMKWYGHVTRAWGFAKTVLQGTVRGGRRRGRQRKRWEDNIRDWMGLELSDPVRRAEEREEWRMLVARSCGCSNGP